MKHILHISFHDWSIHDESGKTICYHLGEDSDLSKQSWRTALACALSLHVKRGDLQVVVHPELWVAISLSAQASAQLSTQERLLIEADQLRSRSAELFRGEPAQELAQVYERALARLELAPWSAGSDIRVTLHPLVARLLAGLRLGFFVRLSEVTPAWNAVLDEKAMARPLHLLLVMGRSVVEMHAAASNLTNLDVQVCNSARAARILAGTRVAQAEKATAALAFESVPAYAQAANRDRLGIGWEPL